MTRKKADTRHHALSYQGMQHPRLSGWGGQTQRFIRLSFAEDLRETANPLILMVDTTGIEPVTPTMSTYFSLSTPSDLSDFARQIRDVSKWCAKRFGSLNLEHYPKRALRDFSNRHAISDAFRIFASTTPCGVRRRSRSCETAARNSHRRDQAMPKHSGESLRHASWLMAEVSLAFKDVDKPVRYPPRGG